MTRGGAGVALGGAAGAEVGPAHAAVLAAIHAAAFPADAWDAGVLADQLARPGCFALLAGTNGMVLARVAADEAEILTIAVTPGARRRGIGAGLLAAAMRRAAAAGARAMFLEVAATNAPAQGLYERAGFRRVGRRARYYPGGGDALVLRAVLPEPSAKASEASGVPSVSRRDAAEGG